MSEKPTRWDYTTTAILALLCAFWLGYEYYKDPSKFPFEPLIAFLTSVFVIWGINAGKKGKKNKL
ncbi:MAG: hypothetical protein IPL35_08750 [Sphingobacteriales bacterium]|nr:hypothetical protein [Sphingobacteriales bacterium]